MLNNLIPKEDWLIPDILPKNATVILTSSLSAGKTTLALDLAYCASTGNTFIGRPIEKCKVLFVNMIGENQPSSLAYMIEKRGFFSSENTYIGFILEIPLNKIEKLAESLKKFSPDLVIVDGLSVASLFMSQGSTRYRNLICRIRRILDSTIGIGTLIIVDSAHKRNRDLGLIDRWAHYPVYFETWSVWHLDFIENPIKKFDQYDPTPDTSRRFLQIRTKFSLSSESLRFNRENLSYVFSIGSPDLESLYRVLQALNSHQDKSAKAIGKIAGVDHVYSILDYLVTTDRIECISEPPFSKYVSQRKYRVKSEDWSSRRYDF